MELSNQRFCRELNIAVPDNAVSASDKMGLVDSIFQVALQFDLKDPSVELKTDEQLAKILMSILIETQLAIRFEHKSRYK
jgi:hypothetical protein